METEVFGKRGGFFFSIAPCLATINSLSYLIHWHPLRFSTVFLRICDNCQSDRFNRTDLWWNLGGKCWKEKNKTKQCRLQYKFVVVYWISRIWLLQPHGLQPTRLLCPWDFPGKNTGVGWHFLLQGIFLTQESNLCLLHCRQILYHWTTREALTVQIALSKNRGYLQ